MKKILLACIIFLATIPAVATQIVITQNSGSNIAQDVAIIGKWVFAGADLQLLDKAGNLLASEPINNIRKITFAQGTPSSLENTNKKDIYIFPNPTHDILIINGIEAQNLRIYDLQGKVVHREHGTEVNVSNLPSGTYLLQVGTQVVRFIKK
jgi:hypothetical protein